VPQEARLRRCLQEPPGGFAEALARHRLTKRSPELRLDEVHGTSLPCAPLKKGKERGRSY
jgi:hypothetical protein